MESAIAHHFRTVARAGLKEVRTMSTIEQEASPRKRRFGERCDWWRRSSIRSRRPRRRLA